MIEVSGKDLYQFLVSECRYGYTRSNHLMPSCAYDHVLKCLPLISKEDSDFALSTAKQLLEECINYLSEHFSDGIDDDFNNRKESISFITKLSDYITIWDEVYTPYNYDKFVENVNKDTLPCYNIYKMSDNSNILLTSELLSRQQILDFICKQECGTSEATFVYRKYKAENNKDLIYDFGDTKYLVKKEK